MAAISISIKFDINQYNLDKFPLYVVFIRSHDFFGQVIQNVANFSLRNGLATDRLQANENDLFSIFIIHVGPAALRKKRENRN